MNETNADTSHIHTLCLVRRSWPSHVVCLASDVVYWPKKVLQLGWTRAAKNVSPGFPDEKSLPGYATMFPVPIFCEQQPTSTDLDTSFTPGLRLQVSPEGGVLFPRHWSPLGFVRSVKPRKKQPKTMKLHSYIPSSINIYLIPSLLIGF